MDQILPLVQHLPESGVVVLAIPGCFTADQCHQLVKVVKAAKEQSGSQATFLLVPEGMRLSHIPEDQLQKVGLQRVPGQGE